MLASPLDRLKGIYARHGVWGALGLVPHNAALVLRAWSPQRRRARRREREFDRRHGIDTATPAPLSTLGVDGDSARHAVGYMPSGFEFVRGLIGRLAIRHADYTFVDLGCGKGRILLAASHFPFRDIVGVEFSERLAAIARANVAAYQPADRRCRRIAVLTHDAAHFAPPDGPLLLYLYNAFDDVILGRVAANLEASLARAPRDVLLVYVNPEHRAVLERVPCLGVIADDGGTVIYRTRLS
jgi:SAM-dependent methyltransferase